MVRSQPIYGPHINSARVESLDEALSMLRPRGEDGPFYLVASYMSTSSASATLNSIKTGRRKVPDGEYDYKVNVRKDVGRSYLYAKRIK